MGLLIAISALQALKFSQPDGCFDCVSLAYDCFPLLSWLQFCMSWTDSSTVRESWTEAKRLRDGGVQNFKVRGSVDSDTGVGFEIDNKYWALTETEFLERFKSVGSMSFFE